MKREKNTRKEAYTYGEKLTHIHSGSADSTAANDAGLGI